MSEKTETNTDSTTASYVIPMYSLVAFVLNTKDANNINTSVSNLMKQVENNIEIKGILGLMSGKISEIISKIDPDFAATIFIPNAFVPSKDTKDSEIIKDFVSRLNDAIAQKMEEDSENANGKS